MPLLDEIKAHREEILALGNKYGIKDIRVFGSVARGEEKENSDIDLLINIDKQNYKDAFDFLVFQESMQNLLHRKVDIVSESGLYHMLKPTIMREAIAV